MPWQAARVGTRDAARTPAVALLLVALLLLAAAGCTGDDGAAPATPTRTTDADCVARLPDEVFATLGWTPTGQRAEITVRGCHREAEQGYVEVRDRSGYERLCRTLDRSGGVRPGVPVDWLGQDVEACAVEPAAGLGQTRVVVQRGGDDVTQVTVAALADTAQELVRAAVEQVLAASPRPRSGARPSWSRGSRSWPTGPARRSSPARPRARGARA